jgi:outer membrane receptor for ferrienterochelin and colicins
MPNRSSDFAASNLSHLTWALLLPCMLPQWVAAQATPAANTAQIAPASGAQPEEKVETKAETKAEAKPGTKDVKKSENDAAVQKVEVKGKAYDARRQDTASKTVITHEEIVRFGDTNLSDVLKRLPGVTVGGGVRFRGLGRGYTSVLLNGDPAPPGFQIDSLPPDSIEKIEIVRSASAEFSTQAIAGTINIVTKNVVQTAQRELKIGVGDQGGRVNQFTNLQMSDKKGAFSYTLAGGFGHFEFDSGGDSHLTSSDARGVLNSNIVGKLQSYSRFDGLNLNPRLNWKLANGDTLVSQSFFRYGTNYSRSRDDQQTLLGPLPAYSFNSTDNRGKSTNLNSNLNWLRKLENGGKLDFKVGLSYSQRTGDTRFLGGDRDDRLQLDRKNHSTSRNVGFTSSGKYSIVTQKDHTLVFGWDGASEQRRDARVQTDVLPVGANPGRFVPINLDENFKVKVRRMAFFGQDEWSLSKNFSLYLGLRWEGVQTDSTGTSVANASNRFGVVSPIVQTLWKLPDFKDTQIRAGLARTYKAPDLGNLNARRTLSTENDQTRPDSQGNPNLRPELAWGLDFAFERFLPEGGILSASSYVRRINDLNVRTVALIDGRWVSRPVNEGQALSRGIELEAKFPLRVLMADGPAIDFRFNLTRNWSRVSSVPGPDNRLDSQTPLSATIGLDYRMASLPLTLGGSFSFQQNGHVRISEEQSSYTSPGRSLDVYGLWKFNRKDQVRLSLGNVANRDSIIESTYADASGSNRQTSSNNSPLSVRLFWEHKF